MPPVRAGGGVAGCAGSRSEVALRGSTGALWRPELGTFVVREDATERALRNSEGRVHRRSVAAGQVAF